MSRNIDVASLEAACVHIDYEVDMFRWSAWRLCTRPPDDVREANALLESFTIHTRNLAHFFWPRGKVDDDDILASDYCPAWAAIGLAYPTDLKSARTRVGVEIAHLSLARSRVPADGKNWHLGPIADALEPALLRFADAADPQLLVPTTRELIRLGHRRYAC